MNKPIVYSGLLCCVAGFFAALLIPEPVAKVCAMAASVVGIVALYCFDRSRERRQRQEKLRLDGLRKSTLLVKMENPGFVLEVFGSTGLGISLLLIMLGVLTLLFLRGEIVPPLVGSFLILMGGMLVAMAAQKVGKPLLQLSRTGIDCPDHGRIPWREISGVDMMETHYRGMVLNHLLVFHVPNLSRYISQFAWYQKFLFRLRPRSAVQRIVVNLNKPSEQPNVVLDVCRELLRQATGRNHAWSLWLSGDENEAFLRFQESSRKTEDLARAAEKAFTTNDVKAIERIAGEMETERRRCDREFERLQAASASRVRKSALFLKVTVLLLLIFFGWRLWLALNRLG